MYKHNLNINYAMKLLRAMITRNDIDRAHRHSGKKDYCGPLFQALFKENLF